MTRVHAVCGAVAAAVLLAGAGAASGQIGFAENQADRIRLWNASYFELAFRKADGRLLYILDKTTNQQVSPGNVHGPWVAHFTDGTWLDGENFSPSNASRRFTYTWDATNAVLTLDYLATGTYASHVVLTIRPSNGPEVDTTLSMSSQSVREIDLLAYPVQLSFLRSQTTAVYMPYIEGVRLLPAFLPNNDFSSRYPGQMFADFASTELTTGRFSVYAIHDPNAPLIPAAWTILRDTFAGGTNKYHHDYTLQLTNGQQWTSPTIVLNVGSSLSSAMASYWTRSGHDTIPTLAEKLGPALFSKLANAVLLKRDFLQGSWTFASFQSFLSSLPANNLVHLVAFWPNGFDQNYPDYLPPNAALGNLAALQNLVTAARSSGHIVMPYTNPTWWDDQSPTLSSLGTGIAARDRSGALIYETYGSNGGYVVSPYSPAVIARQDQTRDEFTQTVPCDLLFEDQLGARGSPTYGAHPNCPDPILYTQGLVDVAERSASRLPIMSEGGYDRLSRYESGFCLSQTVGWQAWASNTYTAYPMAPLWAHRNLYFNAHNLAGTVMSNDLPKLTYYIAMGYSLSHDLSALDLDWLKLLDCFQKHLISSLVGVGMSSFENLPPSGQTRTTFEDGTVITANLTGGTMTQGNHVIASNGFIAEQSGKVRGGALRTLHGQVLSGTTPHYLVIEYADYRMTIYQPRGDNGALTFPRPAAWIDDARIHAIAVTVNGSTFSQVVNVSPTTVSVNYASSISGQSTRVFAIFYCRSADLDCDGYIDSDDYLAFQDCMSGPEMAITPTPPRTVEECLGAFDSDGDLDVDMDDLVAFQQSIDGPP